MQLKTLVRNKGDGKVEVSPTKFIDELVQYPNSTSSKVKGTSVSREVDPRKDSEASLESPHPSVGSGAKNHCSKAYREEHMSSRGECQFQCLR